MKEKINLIIRGVLSAFWLVVIGLGIKCFIVSFSFFMKIPNEQFTNKLVFLGLLIHILLFWMLIIFMPKRFGECIKELIESCKKIK